MNTTILIVEDENDIREVLAFNLERAGYNVLESASAEEALTKFEDAALILLDVMLPHMSGYKFAELLRTSMGYKNPIIFLTALGTEGDVLKGFESGADDYIAKPFSINEVLARIKAVLSRCNLVGNKIITCGPLSIDIKAQTATIDGKPIELSMKEFEILCTLAQSPDTYFSRSSLMNKLWQDAPYVVDRTIDVHITRIRNKLGEHRGLIKNKTGFGYYLSKNSSKE